MRSDGTQLQRKGDERVAPLYLGMPWRSLLLELN